MPCPTKSMMSISFGTYLLLLASLAAAASWEAPPTLAAGSGCEAALCADAEAAPGLGLLQSMAGVREARRREVAKALQTPASPRLPPVNAVNRTLYSTDPRASADFFLRYFYGARSVPAESFGPLGSAICLEAAAVELSYKGQTMGMLFVKDVVKSEGLAHLDSFVKVADAEWEKIMSRQQRYSPWVDFHDGLPAQLLNVHRLAKDGVRLQLYEAYVYRLNVPHTAWTVEVVATDMTGATAALVMEEDKQYLYDQFYIDPDLCRRFLPVNSSRLWWKATFAAADPLAAANFAVAVLGARWIETPYPLPFQSNCTEALWVKLPSADGSTGMELHFVDSSVYPPGNLSVQHFNHYQERLRSSRPERLERYLYNSLVLVADDLDPFVLKMQALGAPFLALRLAPGKFALVFSFPRNDAITVQIQSSRLAAVKAVEFEPCRAE